MTSRKQTFFIGILTLIATGLGLISCDNDRNLVPAFIVINKEDITVQCNLFEGCAVHDFSDVWVKVNGKHLGCWELPARIPVLDQGNCNIVINAGIILNGMKSSHSAYSFFNPFEITANLEPRKETRINPKFTYLDNITVPFTENFQGSGGIKFIPSPDSQADISALGVVELNDTAIYFDLRTENLNLRNDGTYRTFFEFNYNIEAESNKEVSIGVGLIAVSSNGNTTHHPIVMINPTRGQWKKIYVDLSQIVGQNSSARSFILQITGFRETDKAVKFQFGNMRILQHLSYF